MSDPSKKDGFRCYKASGAIVATSSVLIHSDPWADLLFFVARGSRCAIFLDPLSFSKWLEHRETLGEFPQTSDDGRQPQKSGTCCQKYINILYPKMAAVPRCHKGESMIKAGHICDYIHVSCVCIYIYTYCHMHPYA